MSNRITHPPENASPSEAKGRRIRSFVTRAGRVTPAQQRALDEYAPLFCIPFSSSPPRFQNYFGQEADLIMEIGFGMGETTAQIAESIPDKNFLAVDVHSPGVGSLLKQIGERSLENVRIIQHDAVDVLTHMISPSSLYAAHLFFPDPWQKARHHKRRLIQPPFVQLLTSRIRSGGYVHCATDWEHYALQMLTVLEGEPFLENTSNGFTPRPHYRPETKYEKRGKRLGHSVWDLVFACR